MHVPSHVQNSFLRRANKVPFPSKVGLLKPDYTGKEYRGYTGPDDILDYPILFFNNKNTPLYYGQPVVFLPYLVGRIKKGKDKGKWLVVAKNIGVREDSRETASASDEREEEAYKETDSFKIIYCGAEADSEGKLKKSDNDLENKMAEMEKMDPTKRSNHVIEWIIKNAISFDEMNLATN